MLFEEPRYLMKMLEYHVQNDDDLRFRGEEKLLAYLIDETL